MKLRGQTILPLKVPSRENNSFGSPGNQKGRLEAVRIVDTPISFEPYLSNNNAFNVMDFCGRFFSFSKNFLGDYQLLSVMYLTQLYTLLETHLGDPPYVISSMGGRDPISRIQHM